MTIHLSSTLLSLGGVVLLLASMLRTWRNRPRRRATAPSAPAAAASAEPPPASAGYSSPPFATPVPVPVAPAAPAADRRLPASAVNALTAKFAVDREQVLARAAVERQLATLNPSEWHIEREVVVNLTTFGFVVLGPTGTFLLAPTVRWGLPDLPVLARCAARFSVYLPGYPDPVRAALVLARSTGEPRWWFSEDGEDGGWVVPIESLVAWLTQSEDQGVGAADVALLRAPTRQRVPEAS
jgi:hypothetical protein